MSTTAVQRFYRYHARVYDATRWAILHGRRRAVQALGLRPDSRVLEVGCGTGRNFPLLLARLDPARGRLTGLDFSAEMLARARRRWGGNPAVTLLEADATQFALPERCDAILFAYSLTMIPDWRTALERAVAHLAPGGTLVVLDFGRFERWGPLAPLLRGWLRLNHVETRAPYAAYLRTLLPETTVTTHVGGYYFLACGRRTAQAW